MLLMAGIGLSVYGIIGFISLFLKVQKASNSVFMRVNEAMLFKMVTIDTIALIVGIVLIIFAVVKSRNKNALDQLRNNEKNAIEQAKCKSCGLNLSENTKICPQCGVHVDENGIGKEQ